MMEVLTILVRQFYKTNGGKASALNFGIKRSKGSIIISLDADSVLHKDTLAAVVASFRNPTLSALGGNVKVSNRGKLLNKIQGLEYIQTIRKWKIWISLWPLLQVVEKLNLTQRQLHILKAQKT